MGIPTSEVGYTSATTRRETTKSIRDMWWHWIKKNKIMITNSQLWSALQPAPGSSQVMSIQHNSTQNTHYDSTTNSSIQLRPHVPEQAAKAVVAGVK
jgi:hypothetical protein